MTTAPSPAKSSDEDLDAISAEDLEFVNLYTNAGKHISDLRSKAQEELLKKLNSAGFDEDRFQLELSPPEAKKTRVVGSRIQDGKSECSVNLFTPEETAVSSPITVVSKSTRRVTRSQVAQGRGRGRSRGRGKRGLTTSDDYDPSPVAHVASKLLPRPKILEGSPITLSDDSDEDVSITSLLVEEDINYEVSVKVCWRFKDVHRFKIRKFQKLTSVFEYFSKLENVPENQIQLTLHDDIIMPSDSPDSLQLSIANIIEGSVVVQKPPDSLAKARCHSPVNKDLIQLKVCTKDSKEPIIVKIRKTDKMMVLMSKISEEVEKPLDSMKFLFDGESLNPNETPDDLDLEGGELIELRIAKS